VASRPELIARFEQKYFSRNLRAIAQHHSPGFSFTIRAPGTKVPEQRGRQVIVPHGDTVLKADDVLVVIAEGDARDAVRRLCQPDPPG